MNNVLDHWYIHTSIILTTGNKNLQQFSVNWCKVKQQLNCQPLHWLTQSTKWAFIFSCKNKNIEKNVFSGASNSCYPIVWTWYTTFVFEIDTKLEISFLSITCVINSLRINWWKSKKCFFSLEISFPTEKYHLKQKLKCFEWEKTGS